ncbi:hypothetical protein Gorai_022865 [Gossypium raimondii]|uniref:ANK_REP_REGION domain-containing protein n=1 Tax=Gossypium raimondii TaxID=29730 RepID=A0A7J8NUT4_GOSRA|nr:hypothetical protein [Gossypium raimondii]
MALEVFESVRANDHKAVYRYIVFLVVYVNFIHGQASYCDSLDQSSRYLNSMVEVFLQYGANINAFDSIGRTPLHLCILSKKYAIANCCLQEELIQML